jgi:hypothetical protein
MLIVVDTKIIVFNPATILLAGERWLDVATLVQLPAAQVNC